MSGNCVRIKFSSILQNKYFLRKICLSIIGLFTFVLVCLVITMIWTKPDTQKVQGADVFCRHVDMVTGGHVQCRPIQTEFHWYLKRKFAEENQHLLEKENEYREKSNQIDLKIYPKITTVKVRPAAKLVGKKHTGTSIDRIVEGLVPIRHWLSHGRNMWARGGYVRYGIRYNMLHVRFIVPVAGVYLVYSYLSLYEPCIPDTGLPNIANNRARHLQVSLVLHYVTYIK